MNKNIIYVIVAGLVGLLIGWLVFSTTEAKDTSNEHQHTEGQQVWTCSMHPQIQQQEPGDCPICGMDLIPMENDSNGLNPNEIKMTENAIALAGIETMIVGEGDANTSGMLKLSGKIQVNEKAEAIQAAYFDGRIEKLNVNYEGAEVKKGQLLATIYAPALVAAQQELLTAARIKESQPALYEAVRNKLKLWKLSDKQIDQVEKDGKVKENFPVYANVSGVVSAIMVEEGDYVKTGMPLLKIANLNTVWAVFDAYENQIALFEEGQNLKVYTRSYPNESFVAKLSFIDPILDGTTRTLQVRAVLKNPKGRLKPGMFVQGEINVDKTNTNTSISVPETAVLWTGERSLVYVKTKKDAPVFEMREVTLGNLVNGHYNIVSGLEGGEEIVSSGTFTVDAAAQLQGKKSMMNQNMDNNRKSVDFSDSFEKEFTPLVTLYLAMKDALVEGDKKKSKAAAEKLRKEMETLSGSYKDELKSYWTSLYNAVSSVENSTSIDVQRSAFQLISDQMIQIVSDFNESPQTLFVQRCPMANNNKGAEWLSEEKEIKNPYFGDAMLTCGETKQVLFEKSSTNQK
ncbi:efflux RND transporter periplasmic adaptor subunit [Flavobacteriaceae bacterium M23B6Z8]